MPLFGPQPAPPSEDRGATRYEWFETPSLSRRHEPVEQPNETPASTFCKLLVGRTRYFVDERWNILIPAVPDGFLIFEKPFDERKRRKY
jgi:hypothetical protein